MLDDNFNELEGLPLLDGIKERFRKTVEAWDKNYKQAISDVAFLNSDNQWPAGERSERVGKPTIASDRINAQVKSIVNAQRDNRPAVLVSAVNDEADEEVANVLQGIIRHIEYQSKASLAYDTANEFAVQGGLGFIRINLEYEEDSFNQRIKIDAVSNPFMVYIDPSFKSVDGSDIDYAFILEPMTYEEFKESYPSSALSLIQHNEWYPVASRFPEWFDNDKKTTVVCEYFVKEYEKYTLVKLKDGTVKDKKDCSNTEKAHIVQSREASRPTVKWYKLACGIDSPAEILEETDWVGKDIPIIPVFGDVLLDNGSRVFSGLVHNTKESQVMLNTIQTVILEQIARSPKNPWVVPAGAIEEYKEYWANVNTLDLPYLPYNTKIEGMGPGEFLPAPTRMTAEPPIQGMLQALQVLENDIKASNAIYDPTLGEKMANDQSGVAIKALQQAGNIAHYNYSDNLSRAIHILGLQLLDLIRKIYTEERVIRIIGLDDKHKLVKINGETDSADSEYTQEGVEKVYDITTGEYDVSVSSGPSFATRRAENMSFLVELVQYSPNTMQFVMDKIVGLMDFPESQDIKERLEKLLPPALQDEDKQKNNPQVLQQELTKAQALINQLSQTLQQETQLADKEAMKFKIATLENQTELIKQQRDMQHEGNLTAFKAEIAEIKAASDHSKALLQQVHQHILDTGAREHQTAMDITQSMAENALSPQEQQSGQGTSNQSTQSQQ
jgi:hypothetical protein